MPRAKRASSTSPMPSTPPSARPISSCSVPSRRRWFDSRLILGLRLASASIAAHGSAMVSTSPLLKARSSLRTVSGSVAASSRVTISAMPYSSGIWSWYSIKRSALGSSPASIDAAISVLTKPNMPSHWPANSWGSIMLWGAASVTVRTALMSSPVLAQNSGKSSSAASCGCAASSLPAKSCGVRMVLLAGTATVYGDALKLANTASGVFCNPLAACAISALMSP